MATIADKLAKQQKEISVAEFFEKNRHLLGFDSKIKAMLTVIKEAVDNSLDACEERHGESKGKEEVLPEIYIDIKKIEDVYDVLQNGITVGEIVRRGDEFSVSFEGRKAKLKSKYAGLNFTLGDYKIKLKIDEQNRLNITVNGRRYDTRTGTPKYRVIVRDNGPGIVKEQMPRIFGQLLYGSKFHRLRQARGQQGIGITSAVLYSQLTTGRPILIRSRTGKNKPAQFAKVLIDTINNRPEVIESGVDKEFKFDHGTEIQIEFEAQYLSRGPKSVEEYLKRTSLVNPHTQFIFNDVDRRKHVFKRTSKTYPKRSIEIKPHPYGLELGILIKMLRTTSRKNLIQFITKDFSRISHNTALIIFSKAELRENQRPRNLSRTDAEMLLKAMQRTKLLRPPTMCLSPIGQDALKKSIKTETKAEFVTSITRNPTTYRGMPFQVEVAIAYGGEIPSKTANIMRFANKIPLLYDRSSCAVIKAVSQVGWRRYNIDETSTGMPSGPIVILVHVLSVWVPYTSEGKAAIANYPEIIKEIKLALQDASRDLKRFIGARYREQRRKEKVSKFILYAEEVAPSLSNITKKKEEKIKTDLKKLITKKLGKGG